MAEGIVGCHLVSVLCLVVQLGVPLDVADNVPSPEEDAQRPDGVRLLEEDVDVSEGITDFEGLSPTHTYTISTIIKGSFFTKTKETILLPRFNRCGEEGLGLCHSFELSERDRRGPARFLAFEDCPHKYLTSFLSRKFRIQKS